MKKAKKRKARPIVIVPPPMKQIGVVTGDPLDDREVEGLYPELDDRAPYYPRPTKRTQKAK